MTFWNSLPDLTKIFILVMILACLFIHLFRFSNKVVALAPSLFTTFGIFATFVGIALGLLHFDVANIQGSIPDLLDGLKMAFWASVFGVGSALTIKFRYATFGIPKRFRAKLASGSTIDDLVNQMVKIERALVGDEEFTLLAKLHEFKEDNALRLDEVKISLSDYMEKMSDNNSKALIEALEDVMKDFNSKINEQFGDNFKQLNEAVANILVWQEKYREQVTEMIEQQGQTARDMSSAAIAYQTLVDKSDAFVGVANRLDESLQEIGRQRGEMEKSITEMDRALGTAVNNLPQLHQQMMQFIAEMNKAVQLSNDSANRSLQEMSGILRTSMTSTAQMLQTSNQEFNEHIKEMTAQTHDQVAILEAALEIELAKSLDGLGRQLTALSQKFVEDYTPLTERLRSVLSVGARV